MEIKRKERTEETNENFLKKLKKQNQCNYDQTSNKQTNTGGNMKGKKETRNEGKQKHETSF